MQDPRVARKRIRTITVIWGNEFVDIFLRVGLRSLLANGNILDLAKRHEVIFTVYTTSEDAERLRTAPDFQRLRSRVAVEFSIFSPAEIDVANYGSHVGLWEKGLELARQNRQILFFLPPDLIYAEQALIRWAQRFEEGAKMVFMPGIQVALETVLPELEKRFSDSPAVSVNQGELFDLLFRHFHPLHASMRRTSMRRPPHPEYDIRTVPRQGIVIREIVSHPFCLDTAFFSRFAFFVPNDHLDTAAFEQCHALSVEPLLKRINLYYRPSPLSEATLSNLGSWYCFFGNEACEKESNFPYEVPLSAEPIPQPALGEAIAAGRFYRTSVIASGQLYKLFDAMRRHGLIRASELLAFATYALRLRRRLLLQPGATLFVPTDEALARERDRVYELLMPGREKDFLELLQDHVVPASGTASQWFTATGHTAEGLLAKARLCGDPFACGDFTVVPIDQVLWRHDLASDAAGEEQGATTGIFGFTKWAQRSRIHRMIYVGLHVPFLESILAPLVPVYFLRDPRRPGRFRKIVSLPFTVARGIRSATAGIPIVGRVVNLAFRVLRSLMVDGVGKTFERICRRIPGADVLMQRMSRCVLILRQGGLGVLLRKVFVRVSSSPLMPSSTIPLDAVKRLETIRYARALQAASEVLDSFYRELDLPASRSAAFTLAQSLAATLAPATDEQTDGISSELTSLVDSYPRWSEAWLELGFYWQDRVDTVNAIRCFKESISADRCSDVLAHQRDPRAMAAACLGRLLVKQGLDAEACDAFAFALSHDVEQRIVAIDHAAALRRTGAIQQALRSYCVGMLNEETRWSLPALPRHASRLQERISLSQACSLP